jgi:hypothetical protein
VKVTVIDSTGKPIQSMTVNGFGDVRVVLEHEPQLCSECQGKINKSEVKKST